MSWGRLRPAPGPALQPGGGCDGGSLSDYSCCTAVCSRRLPEGVSVGLPPREHSSTSICIHMHLHWPAEDAFQCTLYDTLSVAYRSIVELYPTQLILQCGLSPGLLLPYTSPLIPLATVEPMAPFRGEKDKRHSVVPPVAINAKALQI